MTQYIIFIKYVLIIDVTNVYNELVISLELETLRKIHYWFSKVLNKLFTTCAFTICEIRLLLSDTLLKCMAYLLLLMLNVLFKCIYLLYMKLFISYLDHL